MTFDQVSRRAVDELRNGLEGTPIPELHILVRRERRRRALSTLAGFIFVVAASVPLSLYLSRAVPDVANGDLPTRRAEWSRVMFESRPEASEVYAITVVGSGLVAVGADDLAAVWTSTDGRAWSRVPSEDLGPGTIFDVTAGGPGLVAVGESYNQRARNPEDPNRHAPVIWTSADGLNWRRSDPGLGQGSSLTSLIAGGPGVVAVGSQGIPPDDSGLPSSAPNADLQRVHGVAEQRSRPQAWFSSDGVTWTQASLLPTDHPTVYPGWESWVVLRDLAVAGNQLVATGEIWTSGPIGLDINVHGVPDVFIWTSADGMTWASVPIDPEAFPRGSRISSIVGGPAGFVAVGSSGGDVFDRRGMKLLVGDPAVWTSPDGVKWQRVPTGPDSFFSGYSYGLQADGTYVYPYVRSVAGGTDGYVAVGGDGAHCQAAPGSCGGSREAAVWTSPDGETWQRVPTGPVFLGDAPAPTAFEPGTGADSVIAWGNQFVAVGSSDGRRAIWISE